MGFIKTSDNTFFSLSFLMFAVPIVIFLAIKMPPFQVADEVRHFARADQLTHGDIFPMKEEKPDEPGVYVLGGTVDPGIFAAESKYAHIQHHQEVKVDPVKDAEARSISWTKGVFHSTPLVGIYPSVHYVVSASGILLGRFLNLTIVDTLILSRILNAVISLLVITYALSIINKGIGIFYVLLLLPMTLAQIASTSQDATCFAASALCVALFSHLGLDNTVKTRRRILFGTAALLVLIGFAKPPWVGLSLFYLYYAMKYREDGQFVSDCILAFFATLSLVVIWGGYLAKYVSVPFGEPGVEYEQALFVIQHPMEFLGILIDSWIQQGRYRVGTFIANLGYLDTPFHYTYYAVAVLTMFYAMAAGYIAEKGAMFSSLRTNFIGPFSILVIVFIGMSAVVYILWAPLGHPRVDIQGRYLIPVALFVALGASDHRLTAKGQITYRSILLTFALVTLIVTCNVVLSRYY